MEEISEKGDVQLREAKGRQERFLQASEGRGEN